MRHGFQPRATGRWRESSGLFLPATRQSGYDRRPSRGVIGEPAVRRIIVAATMLTAFMATTRADFQEGFAAHKRGDYATALREWRPLAEQGYADAQYNLGILYENGGGVPQDYVQAHLWFNLAAAQGYKEASKNRGIIADKMTPAQIAEAQRLAREWKPKKQ